MRFHPLREAVTIGMCLIGLLAACDSAGKNGKKDSSVSQAGSNATRNAAALTGTGEPHETDKPIGGMAPTDWVEYLKTVTFDQSLTKQSLERSCVGATTEDSDQCFLEITPVENVYKFKFATARTNGVVLAKIYNRGPLEEKTFAIPAHHTVLWVVDATHSQFIDVDNSYRPTPLTVAMNFTLCESNPNTKSDAGFYKCKYSPGHMVGVKGVIPQKYPTYHTSPPWVTCAEGCCNADGQ